MSKKYFLKILEASLYFSISKSRKLFKSFSTDGLQQNVINSFDVNKNRLNNAKNIITNLNNRYNSLTSLLI